MRKSFRLKTRLMLNAWVSFVALASFSIFAFAANQTLRLDNDSNSRIVVENAIVKDDQTTILFRTWPDLGNPNSGKPCPLNFYSVTLRPGLPSATLTVLAKGVCGSGLSKGSLLPNGDVQIIARDSLELWRAGERISSKKFTSIDATRALGVTSDEAGSQLFAFSPAGDLVVAMTAGGRIAPGQPGASWLVTGLQPDHQKRWQLPLGKSAEFLVIEQMWAGSEGGALLYLQRQVPGSAVPALEPQLLIISASGGQSSFPLIEMSEPIDFQSNQPGSMEDLQEYFEQTEDNKPESIKSLSARARVDGGFDVLFHREAESEARAGHFLYRFAADGSLQSESALGGHLEQHGLAKWTDFYVEGDHLLVLSKVLASQHGVVSKRKKWMQNAVSQVDLGTGMPDARLVPLDQRYLEAAMNAGDEGQQHLEGQPGGEPVLLTSLGKLSLAVEVGFMKGRNTLRLNEISNDLSRFTEDFDELQAKLAKYNARQQKKADREVRNSQMNTDLAAAAGMTPEAFAALSNKERKQAMVRNGDTDAIMAATTKQSESMMQAMIASGASPEQIAQMQSAMAQAQQMMQGGGNMPESQPAAAAEKSEPPPVLVVDSLLRGYVQYKSRDGKHTTLIVYNRETGEELLLKEYQDGTIDEYVNLGQYKLPLEKIGILIRNISGEILENLTPKASS